MDAGRGPPRRIRIVRNDLHRDLRLDIDGMSYEVNTYKLFNFKSYFSYQCRLVNYRVSSLLKNKKYLHLKLLILGTSCIR
jgi:hypothetical protein